MQKAINIGGNKWRAEYVDVCRNCQGIGRTIPILEVNGHRLPQVCEVCGGSGRVYVVKDITITVTPHK